VSDDADDAAEVLRAYNALPPDASTTRHAVLAVRRWSLPAEHIGRVPVLCVLVGGAIGDYSVYCGVGDPRWVSDHGNKLPLAVALLAFPGIDPARYRGA
jgi:hypothetical protein